jgi:Carboxypeptidase regulatory-like domain
MSVVTSLTQPRTWPTFSSYDRDPRAVAKKGLMKPQPPPLSFSLCALSLLAAVALVAFTASPAEACSCAISKSPCDAVNRSSAVFIGVVSEIKEVAPTSYESTIAVEEVFTGNVGTTAVIHSSWTGASCDNYFRKGDRLLFYASGSASALRLLCSRTRPVDDGAADDLTYLRSIKGTKHGTLSGYVSRGYTGRTSDPVDGARVVARGTTHTAVTNAKGEYRLALPPGRYTIDVEAAENLNLITSVGSYSSNTVEMGPPGSCQSLFFSQTWNNRIRGRVTDHRGKPVAGLSVNSVTADGFYREAKTDARGEYLLQEVPPQLNFVGVSLYASGENDPTIPKTYAPGVTDKAKARRVDVPFKGGLVDKVNIALPPRRPLHELTLRVTYRGKPATFPVSLRETDTYRKLKLLDEYPDPDGLVRIKHPAIPLDWTLCPRDSGLDSHCATFIARPEGPMELSVELPDQDR